MSNAEWMSVEQASVDAETVWLPVAELQLDTSFRDFGLNRDHIEQLVVNGGSWPAIVVRRDGTVVDGAHRVVAARRLGMARIEAVIFDGGPDEAFVEFVRRNVTHGLLLTLQERKRAALRVLRVHPAWSDRRVAEICGLSSKTVGRLRDAPGGIGPNGTGSIVRIGRDDRRRPVERGLVRARVAEAVLAQPTASLRTIAAKVGVSPETVRLVRLNMAQVATVPSPAPEPVPASAPWLADSAMSSCDKAEDLLTWFDRTAITESDMAQARIVPLSRIYEIADEARQRADLWLQIARALEARAAKTS